MSILRPAKTFPDNQSGRATWGRSVSVAIDQIIVKFNDFLVGPDPGLVSYTVATLPSAAAPIRLIYVTDETGGAIPAFNDGTNWRRVTDRAIVA